MKINSIEIQEDLLNEIKGMIATLCSTFSGDDVDIETEDLYFTLSILRSKYRELLIQLGYVKPEDVYSGMTFDNVSFS